MVLVRAMIRDFSLMFLFIFSWNLARHHVFAVAILEFSEPYSTSEGITISRVVRDVGAATWPMVEEIELDVHPRFSRSPETHEEAVILIRDFWLNFGKTADEINESESEIEIIKKQNNPEMEDADVVSINIKEFGESSRANTDEEESLPVIFDATQDNPETADFRYLEHDHSFIIDPNQKNHASVLVPHYVPSPNPQYSQFPPQYPTVPTINPQHQYYTSNVNIPLTPGYPQHVLVPSTTLNPESTLKYPHPHTKPVIYAPPSQMLPSSIPRHDQYGAVPSSSIPPYLLQQILMNSNSQNPGLTTPLSTTPYSYSSTYPSTMHSNPSVPSVPVPNYSYIPSNSPDFRAKSSPYAQPVSSYPTIPVNRGPPPLPTYPYSSSNNY